MAWMRSLTKAILAHPAATVAAIAIVLVVDVLAASAVLAADRETSANAAGSLVLLLGLLLGSMAVIRTLFQRHFAKRPVLVRSNGPMPRNRLKY